ncbi:MAG: hypothetical protein ACE5JM_02130 [Armatimonadota bacterium]
MLRHTFQALPPDEGRALCTANTSPRLSLPAGGDGTPVSCRAFVKTVDADEQESTSDRRRAERHGTASALRARQPS